jgi:hypothetical protein
MSRANQLFNQIIDDLEKSIVDLDPIPFSKYFDSLSVPKALMQKLIEAHDIQIATAIHRASKQKQ